MKKEFYPALGTPTSPEGNLEKDSFYRQIELMIDSGAKGLLCMGSMGKMIAIKDCEYQAIAAQCCNMTNNRIPVMVGVMDCSIGRVLDRIDALGSLPIEGVVATVPYYFALNSNETFIFSNFLQDPQSIRFIFMTYRVLRRRRLHFHN